MSDKIRDQQYKVNQFKRLKPDSKSIYLPVVKIVCGDNRTNWMSITYEQLEQVGKILTKDNK